MGSRSTAHKNGMMVCKMISLLLSSGAPGRAESGVANQALVGAHQEVDDQ